MHWIAQYVTLDIVPSSRLDDPKPIVPDIKDFDNVNYLMSKTELDQQRDDYIIGNCQERGKLTLPDYLADVCQDTRPDWLRCLSGQAIPSREVV